MGIFLSPLVRLFLVPTAIVHGDIRGTSGDVNQAESSRVEGQISTNQSWITVFGGQILGLLILLCLLPLLVLGLLIILLVFILRRRPAASAPPVQAETSIPASENAKQKLTQLKEMLDDGLITEAEYESKKAEILADI